ncbi:hypothetical protein ACFL1X_08500 [Candidatus Hydrogenedentota bacterium]
MKDDDRNQSGNVPKLSRRRVRYLTSLIVLAAIAGLCGLLYTTNRVYFIAWRTHRAISAFTNPEPIREGGLSIEFEGKMESGKYQAEFLGRALVRSYIDSDGLPAFDCRLTANSDIGYFEIVSKNDIWIHLPGAEVVLVGVSSSGTIKQTSLRAAGNGILAASVIDLGYLFAGAVPIIDEWNLSLLDVVKSEGRTLYNISAVPKGNIAEGLVIDECGVTIDSSDWLPSELNLSGTYNGAGFSSSLELKDRDLDAVLSENDLVFKKDLKTSEIRMPRKELWKFLRTSLPSRPKEPTEDGEATGEPGSSN